MYLGLIIVGIVSSVFCYLIGLVHGKKVNKQKEYEDAIKPKEGEIWIHAFFQSSCEIKNVTDKEVVIDNINGVRAVTQPTEQILIEDFVANYRIAVNQTKV